MPELPHLEDRETSWQVKDISALTSSFVARAEYDKSFPFLAQCFGACPSGNRDSSQEGKERDTMLEKLISKCDIQETAAMCRDCFLPKDSTPNKFLLHRLSVGVRRRSVSACHRCGVIELLSNFDAEDSAFNAMHGHMDPFRFPDEWVAYHLIK